MLAEFKKFDHDHEKKTACKMAEHGYNVLFVPKSFFPNLGKRFDVFLCKENVMLQADLKSLTTKNPDTIAKRIKEGSDQANRIVLDINSDINTNDLITGLRSGCARNDKLIEIILLFKSRCYFLLKEKVMSNRIFNEFK